MVSREFLVCQGAVLPYLCTASAFSRCTYRPSVIYLIVNKLLSRALSLMYAHTRTYKQLFNGENLLLRCYRDNMTILGHESVTMKNSFFSDETICEVEDLTSRVSTIQPGFEKWFLFG